MSSDLLFFTGFEGCVSDLHAHQLFTDTGGAYPANFIILSTTQGYLGGKALRIQLFAHSPNSVYTSFEANDEIYMGFHIKSDGSSTNSPFLVISGSSDINFYFYQIGVIRISGTGITTQDVYVPIIQDLYFHFEVQINRSTGTIIMKINGITELTLSGLSIGTYNNRFRLRQIESTYVYFDNIWLHKSKSLGQAISFFSKPVADGHYVPNSGLFHTNDGSSEGWAKLQAMDGDTNYIYSSVANAKFTCKQEEIPIGYNPVAYSIQSVYRHNTGGGLLYVRDLKRYNSLGIDFSGEIKAIPEIYSHSHLSRTNYDEAPDGTELTRDKINDMEIGSKLVELEE